MAQLAKYMLGTDSKECSCVVLDLQIQKIPNLYFLLYGSGSGIRIEIYAWIQIRIRIVIFAWSRIRKKPLQIRNTAVLRNRIQFQLQLLFGYSETAGLFLGKKRGDFRKFSFEKLLPGSSSRRQL
jgi:hypothetical protein